MRLTLFSRLVIGYFAILVLLVAVSVYATLQLQSFSDVAGSILAIDNLIVDYEKKLTDALLSEIRYERKFLITKDNALYDQYLLFRSDFEQYLDEAGAVADSHARELLDHIRDRHRTYQDLVERDVRYLKGGRSYAQSRFKREKETAADRVAEELEKLRTYGQQNTFKRVRELGEAGDWARRVALWMTGAALIFAILLSLFITRSITRPVSLLKRKTRDIAQGKFEGDVKLSSPPEIAELGESFNLMCQRLKELDRMKSDFFSSISHDFRTPLTSIKEGTGLLLEGVGGPLTEKQKRLLGILAEESNRLISLINSLLDLSKMEAGMMDYHLQPSSLGSLIHKAMFEIGPLVEAKKINLEARISSELPVIKVDSERILQALRNLLGNAVKFTPEGGRVTVSARHTDGRVEVCVADTGPGIPAESLAAIFDKYQQASPAGSFRSKGTGLGLAIVRHIVASHGGKVWAESEPGQGSRFVFILPA